MHNKLFILIIALTGLVYTSCTKETAIKTSPLSKFSISNVFPGETPPYDVYINGERAAGPGSTVLLITPTTADSLYQFQLKKAGTDSLLMDTLIGHLPRIAGFSYAYSSSLGLNQFIPPNYFEKPSPDSVAFIFINRFSTGSGKVDITVYKDEDMMGDFLPEDSITTVREIGANRLSPRIALPYEPIAGQGYMPYGVVVRDAVTGKDIWEQVWIDFGGQMNFYFPMNWGGSSGLSQQGAINGVGIYPSTEDYGTGVVYNVFKLGLEFRF